MSAKPLEHLAIIMDGNRRWAKSRMLPSVAGHQRGMDSLKAIVEACGKRGLQSLTVYAFSTENWKRADDEVSGLMDLFAQALGQQLPFLIKNNVQLRFIGDSLAFSEKLQAYMANAQQQTQDNTGLVFQVALNYGGRAEIIQGVKQLAAQVAQGNLTLDDVTEEALEKVMYTYPTPDPDLIIRTGGESRLSNFLMWQSAYSEILVEEALWPDFTPAKLDEAIAEFANRQRRFGA